MSSPLDTSTYITSQHDFIPSFNEKFIIKSNPILLSIKKFICFETVQVATEEHTQTKNGKKICWNYRKGRCRFGSNCTFAHDSDLHKNDDILEQEEANKNKQVHKR